MVSGLFNYLYTDYLGSLFGYSKESSIPVDYTSRTMVSGLFNYLYSDYFGPLYGFIRGDEILVDQNKQVYENQPLTIIYSDNNNEDLRNLILKIDYWSPSNIFSTPTGTILNANISRNVDGYANRLSFTFDENILNESSTSTPWKFQIVELSTNISWDTSELFVIARG